MKDQLQWEEELRDRDGSGRDINLSEHLSRDAALALLEIISAEWNFKSATNSDGEAISELDISSCVGIGAGAASTHWIGGSFLGYLQCYLYWNPAERVFCELTFFPEDIIGHDLFVQLRQFLSAVLIATQSSDYYVRFENASWRHGDTSPHSGVIFSHHSLPLGGG